MFYISDEWQLSLPCMVKVMVGYLVSSSELLLWFGCASGHLLFCRCPHTGRGHWFAQHWSNFRCVNYLTCLKLDLNRWDLKAWNLDGILWTIITFATIFMCTELGERKGNVSGEKINLKYLF